LGVSSIFDRSRRDWALDLAGLFVQGLVVPTLGLALVVDTLEPVVPSLRGAVSLGPWSGFVLSFVVVDYAYYWNHRLLHHPRLFAWHRVHHELDRFDALGSSRNSLLTSALVLYLWCQGLALFLLDDPTGFLLGTALTFALDLYRHSELGPRPDSRLGRVLGRVLVLPHDHAWHHASLACSEPANYGANLILWDRLHGSFRRPMSRPPRLGDPSGMSLARALLWPVAARSRR
jgi:sterol desaturase/sphingolipid hydroxylase (fatty acid hydroxylase superfamily)